MPGATSGIISNEARVNCSDEARVNVFTPISYRVFSFNQKSKHKTFSFLEKLYKSPVVSS